MRSRTRSCYRLLATYQLISAFILYADDYLISYRASSLNSRLVHENLWVSKSMTPCLGNRHRSITLLRDNNNTLKTTINNHEEEFFNFLTQQPLHLKSNQHIQHDKHNSIETLTSPTQCYAVDFNDDFVTITIIASH